jgi:diguanylate cyclase (GGDEF)-like protein/PAS domain S-box-containing protein
MNTSDPGSPTPILDALPVPVALLSAKGDITDVNDAWRRMALSTGLGEATGGIGCRYLDLCLALCGSACSTAANLAAGVLAVLGGTSERFRIEYPCESHAQMRWYHLTVTPVGTVSPRGAAVMLLDITAQKHEEEDLRLCGAAMDVITDAVFLVDRDRGRLVYANLAACQLYGKTRVLAPGFDPLEALGSSFFGRDREADSQLRCPDTSVPEERLWHRHDGVPMWIEIRRETRLIRSRWTLVIMVRDITSRKAAENRIAYLNRVYAVLSGINSLIVRARSRDELFAETCRVAVQVGGFPMAWIGMQDCRQDKIVPIASAGLEETFLSAIAPCLDMGSTSAVRNSMVARAMREKVAIVSNDSQNDPQVLFSERHVRFGIRSIAILPVIVADRAVGVFVLYANECEFFHEDELRLLQELVDDVAFAIDHIERQERLDYLAYYDTLTGIPNRILFVQQLSERLRGAGAPGREQAVVLLDLERFKDINHALGRAAGDSLLRQVSYWLQEAFGGSSIVARVGADVFAIATVLGQDEPEVDRYLGELLDGISDRTFPLGDGTYRVAAKGGVALASDHGMDADTLFKNAEAALQKAKSRNERYVRYSQNISHAVAGRLRLENQLRQAVDREEFVLHYQPKFNVTDGVLVGAEALIRWNDPRTGLVLPKDFVPILEEIGLIQEVGRWALRQSVQDYQRWYRTALAPPPIAVNVSPLQLRDRNFVKDVERIIGIDSAAPSGLELEITEGLIMEDLNRGIEILESIRSLGIRVAIDDFGTGFSSLSYLAKLPIDQLKIDRSFVANMTTGPQGLSLISVVINLAHSLRLGVVAEGVESEDDFRLLRLLGCDEVQGNHFSVPLTSEVFSDKYLNGRIAHAPAEAGKMRPRS